MYMIHIIYMYEYYILYIYVCICICTSIYCTCKYLGHASISATKIKKGHHPISNVARFKEQRWTEALRGCSFPAKQHPFLWK